jgi:hypothetical protein
MTLLLVYIIFFLKCQKNVVEDSVSGIVKLVAKKNGNCQNKIDIFLPFLHSVKTSYERLVRIMVKIQ